METPSFPVLLDLIAGRSAALRKAAGTVPLTTRVPGCPGWSVGDLVAHLGEVQRFWAASVAAGPGSSPPEEDEVPGREPTGDLLTWSEASTGILVDALREAGPDRGCWTWWAASPGPQTSGAVARHQVQEATVHAWDAQDAAGRPEPLPEVAAADSISELITVSFGSLGAWPHSPAQLALRSSEGGQWLVGLSEAGAVLAGAQGDPAVTIEGSASDLVLYLYKRIPARQVKITGDASLAERLLAWLPTD